MWSYARRRRLRLIVTCGIMATGLALAGIAGASDGYWQGLLLNVGSSLLVAAPLALIGSWLIDEVRDVRSRVSLEEAQKAARSAVELQRKHLWERRILLIVRSDQADLLDKWRQRPYSSWDLGENLAERVVRTLMAEVTLPVKEEAEKGGLTERFEKSQGTYGAVLEWAGVSTGQLRYSADDRYIGSPHKEDPGVWCFSVAAFPTAEDTISILLGHHILHYYGYTDGPWVERTTVNVFADTLPAGVAKLAAKWRDSVALYLEALAVLISHSGELD